MMNPVRFLLLTVLLLALGSQVSAADLSPFKAEYVMLRDGKKLGRAELMLRQAGDGVWQFSSHNEGTEGLAGVANVTIREESSFVADDAGLRTQHYVFRQDMLFKSRKRSVDVSGNAVRLDDGDDVHQFPLPAEGVLDRNIVVLALMRDVATAEGERTYAVADKREIDQHRYRFGAVESIDTPAGKFDARRVERIRDTPGRTTTTWFAASLRGLPVRILQVEPDGEQLELQLERRP